MVAGAVLVDREDFGIREQLLREAVELGQVAAHDERRARDAPEGHDRELFGAREMGAARDGTSAAILGHRAERQHVGIGEMAGAGSSLGLSGMNSVSAAGLGSGAVLGVLRGSEVNVTPRPWLAKGPLIS